MRNRKLPCPVLTVYDSLFNTQSNPNIVPQFVVKDYSISHMEVSQHFCVH